MTKPSSNTSNYGRALYHLHEAERLDGFEGIKHALMANARATLALENEIHGGADPSPEWVSQVPQQEPQETVVPF